jgi:hypothetical protein
MYQKLKPGRGGDEARVQVFDIHRGHSDRQVKHVSRTSSYFPPASTKSTAIPGRTARPAHGFPGIPLFAIVHAVSEFIWGVSDNKDMV